MDDIEDRFVDYGENKFEFLDDSPEHIKEVNRRLRETIRKRKVLRERL